MQMLRLYVKSSGKIVSINAENAQRMAKADPKEYQIIEAPVIQSASIPEIPQKKSDASTAANTTEITSNTQPIDVGTAIPTSKKNKKK